MKYLSRDLAAHAITIVVSAVVAEVVREMIVEVRKKHHDHKKNPIGFVQNL